LRKENKKLMNEQKRAINDRLQCAVDELEDRVRQQVERLSQLNFKYGIQIGELKAENMRMLHEIRSLHHCQHVAAWLYFNLRYHYCDTFLGLLFVLILLICGLIYWLHRASR
jgi:hypothetical protein